MIALAFVTAALFGWLGCYILHVIPWKIRAIEALGLSLSYATIYFHTTANPDCPDCKGVGYFKQDYLMIVPCKTCHDVVEVEFVDGRFVPIKKQPEGSGDISEQDKP